jgi:hypothetical protein
LLGEPDGQALWDECEQYQAFTEPALRIGHSSLPYPPLKWTAKNETTAWVLSLDGEWQRCTVHNNGRFLIAAGGKALINSGMSGSPFLDDNGAAIGLVSTGSGDGFNMNPSLADCLPPWLLRKIFGFSRRKLQAF